MPVEFRNAIVCGDARDLARRIPDESVDLVFTDPVYERLDDYYWLSKEASRVLRPGGRFLCFCAIGLLEETMATLRLAGTPVKWTCAIYKPGASQRVFSDVFNHWVALLWCLGSPRKTIADTQVSQLVHLGGPHKWKKGVHAITRHLDGFASPGEIVWDPFCGGGTLAALDALESRRCATCRWAQEPGLAGNWLRCDRQNENCEAMLTWGGAALLVRPDFSCRE